MRIGPYEGRRMGKGRLARRAARTLLCLAAAAALLLPAAGAWAAGAPGKMVIAAREAYVEDGVGFVEGRDADGRVMYCMDPDLHYPDRGTGVSLALRDAAGDLVPHGPRLRRGHGEGRRRLEAARLHGGDADNKKS